MKVRERLWFPDPRDACRGGPLDGLVAVGGDLSVPRLVLAYRTGLFPWTVRPVSWWSPDPRAILEPRQLHISRSLAKLLRKQPFQVTVDRAFKAVMDACAAPAPGRRTTWIAPEFVEAYCRLHADGHAHSVECWRSGELAGGIYGVAVGGLFAGESMFHRVSNASKAALIFLANHLVEKGFELFDIQMLTPVTRQMGATSIPRSVYLRRLATAVHKPCVF